MNRYIRMFGMNERGSMAVAAAIIAVPVMLAAGAAIDYLGAYRLRTDLQGALDAAALAGAASESTSEAARTAMATEYLHSKPEFAHLKPRVASEPASVTVSGSSVYETSLLSLAGINQVPVDVAATAVVISKPICLLALDKSASNAISIWGGSARIVANGCVVHANSSDDSAIDNKSSATSIADVFCAVGGYSGSNYDPTPRRHCRPVTDPYASLAVPSIAGCDYTNAKLTGGTVNIAPGVYCGGLSIGDATVSFAPGVYVMKDGPFSVSGSNPVLSGAGTTFYLYGDKSTVSITGGSSIDLVAPTEGPYAGLLFVQNPNFGGGATSTITGNSDVRLVGVGYFPTQTLSVGGTGNFGVNSPYMVFAANEFEFFGNGTITMNFDAAAAGYSTPAPKEFWGTRLTN